MHQVIKKADQIERNSSEPRKTEVQNKPNNYSLIEEIAQNIAKKEMLRRKTEQKILDFDSSKITEELKQTLDLDDLILSNHEMPLHESIRGKHDTNVTVNIDTKNNLEIKVTKYTRPSIKLEFNPDINNNPKYTLSNFMIPETKEALLGITTALSVYTGGISIFYVINTGDLIPSIICAGIATAAQILRKYFTGSYGMESKVIGTAETALTKFYYRTKQDVEATYEMLEHMKSMPEYVQKAIHQKIEEDQQNIESEKESLIKIEKKINTI